MTYTEAGLAALSLGKIPNLFISVGNLNSGATRPETRANDYCVNIMDRMTKKEVACLKNEVEVSAWIKSLPARKSGANK